ncbi:MAG: hypothetical protein LW700_11305 [Gemmataceae bacterium]|nr:hypothetical protein [Gemmataceae bacterium]
MGPTGSAPHGAATNEGTIVDPGFPVVTVNVRVAFVVGLVGASTIRGAGSGAVGAGVEGITPGTGGATTVELGFP